MSITQDLRLKVREELERFSSALTDCETHVINYSDGTTRQFLTHGAATAKAKRASMELTKILAKFRRGDS